MQPVKMMRMDCTFVFLCHILVKLQVDVLGHLLITVLYNMQQISLIPEFPYYLGIKSVTHRESTDITLAKKGLFFSSVFPLSSKLFLTAFMKSFP